jgi:hypothetical protein
VSKDEREWRRSFTSLIYEMYTDALNRRAVVSELVEFLFRSAPVISFSPVIAEAAQVAFVFEISGWFPAAFSSRIESFTVHR